EPGIQNNVAFLLVETNGNLDEAANLAQQATRQAPGQPNFSDTLGWIYIKKDMAPSALQIFENLVKKYPDEPTYRYHLGVALLKTGNKEKARTALQGALTKNPAKVEAEK